MIRHAIDKAKVRSSAAVKVRRDPHYVPLGESLHLGFRKLDAEGRGTWTARQRDRKGDYHYLPLGSVKQMTYSDAKKAAEKWGKELLDGVGILKDIKTVRDVCDAYVAGLNTVLRQDSATAAIGNFRNHVFKKPIADMHIKDVDIVAITAWFYSLVNKRNPNVSLAKDSMDRIWKDLRAALNYGAEVLKLVSKDRAEEWNKFALIGDGNRRELVLNKKERAHLIESSDFLIQPFFRAMCMLPIRPGAYARCKVSDLDDKIPGNAFLKVYDKKIKKYRDVPLTADTYAFLKKQVRDKSPDDYLFIDEDGLHWTSKTWRRPMEKAREAAGLDPKTCVYTFRHSLITDMIVLGKLDVLTVAKLAGTSIEQINDHYGKLLDTVAREGMARLEQISAII
jgi:integrase